MLTSFQNRIIDLNKAYGLIAVAGKDAQTFLQGQLTTDVTTLTPANSLSAYCNIKGRIRALLRVFLYQDTYYLQMPQALLSKILATLNQYAKFSKVTLQDVSSEWQRFGILAGPEIQTHLSSIAGNAVQLIYPLVDSYSRWELLGPAPLLKTGLHDLLPYTETASFETWKLLDIRARIPEIWPETTEQLFPHYLNLPQLGGVSFHKGCYAGQEIIARMEYRATLKRHLFHAVLATSPHVPLPGTPLLATLEGKEKIGTVISASRTPENTVEMLIEALDSVVHDQPKLFLTIEEKPLEIQIIR